MPPTLETIVEWVAYFRDHLPLLLDLIPLTFQFVGIFGMVWYGFSMIRSRTYQFLLMPFVKSAILFAWGLLLSYILFLFGL